MVKEIEWIVEDGDDKGQHFVISAFSAFEGDDWALDVVTSLARSANKILKETEEDKKKQEEMARNLGMAGLASLKVSNMGLQLFSFMDRNDQKHALKKLLDCCQIKRAGTSPQPITELDISDPMTIVELQNRAFSLNMGFMKAGILRISLLVASLLEVYTDSKNNQESQPNTETTVQ